MEHAYATRSSLNGCEWPVGNKCILRVEFIAVDVAQVVIDKQAEPAAAAPAGSGQSILARLGSRPTEREAGAAAVAADTTNHAAGARPTAGDGPVKGGVRGRGIPAAAAEAAEAGPERSAPKQTEEPQEQPVPPLQQQPAAKAAPDPEEPAVVTLDDLFRKTKTRPCLYWLPLTDEQAAEKRKQAAGSGGGDGTGGRSAAAGGTISDPVGPAVQEGLFGKHSNRH